MGEFLRDESMKGLVSWTLKGTALSRTIQAKQGGGMQLAIASWGA